jgi:HSP20 family protein
MARFKTDGSGSLPSVWSDFFDNDRFFGNRLFGQGERSLPAVNIRENTDEFDLEFAAPGYKKEDFKIHLDDNRLTISAEHKSESKTDNENDRFTRREFSYSSFSRSFTLPQHTDPDKIDAKYTDGILKVCIPKKEEAKALPRKEIRVD